MKFVIATGGSGGHLFPALKVGLELRNRGHDVSFLGSFGVGMERMAENNFAFQNLNGRGFNSKHPQRILSFGWVTMRAAVKAWTHLKKIKPNAVIGFGGYGSFPVVLSAAILKYPTLIHEQNVVPGRANAFLAKFASKIAVSFPKSRTYFREEKTVVTGCPCQVPDGRLSRENLLQWFRLESHKKTIFVFGGSQGSRRINEEFLKAIPLLKKELDFQVIHVCGRKDYDGLKEQYRELQIPFALFDFLDKMDYAYTLADLVIARAGAATVFELALFQVPAILIPYPYAQGHQKENALILKEAGLAAVIEEKGLTTLSIKEEILKGLSRGYLRETIKEELKKICFPHAAERIAREMESLSYGS